MPESRNENFKTLGYAAPGDLPPPDAPIWFKIVVTMIAVGGAGIGVFMLLNAAWQAITNPG